jgi:hypothetical protein
VNDLASFGKGHVVTYAELSKIAGFKVTSSSSKLTSARRILRESSQGFWTPMRGQGRLKRATDVEMSEFVPWSTNSGRRKVVRGRKVGTQADTSQFNRNQLSTHTLDMLQAQIVMDAASKRTKRKLEKSVAVQGSSNYLRPIDPVEMAISMLPGRKRKAREAQQAQASE